MFEKIRFRLAKARIQAGAYLTARGRPVLVAGIQKTRGYVCTKLPQQVQQACFEADLHLGKFERALRPQKPGIKHDPVTDTYVFPTGVVRQGPMNRTEFPQAPSYAGPQPHWPRVVEGSLKFYRP